MYVKDSRTCPYPKLSYAQPKGLNRAGYFQSKAVDYVWYITIISVNL